MVVITNIINFKVEAYGLVASLLELSLHRIQTTYTPSLLRRKQYLKILVGIRRSSIVKIIQPISTTNCIVFHSYCGLNYQRVRVRFPAE